ncbi:DsrE family protein [Bacillus sp. V3B]|uniref:DsrE family protein n=1 Tax=Bacillus sp. V3B TaxID=2804915 RepID=UPI00210DD705|nr:DsrE family protein [Bacillus sp. V3B]MCQ6277287.1 DsrE family protein [Bacillus sp. V3B]
MLRVVIQVNKNGDEYYKKIINNVINLKNKLGEELVDCEVVLFGDGLGLVLSEDETIQKRRETILEMGIRFVICNNTLTKNNMKVEDLQCSVGSAGSGVAHLVTRQAEGWAYLAL